MKNLERLLIGIGASLLLVYVLARVHGFIFSRVAVDSFKQTLAAEEVNGGGDLGAKSPDFSLWAPKRVHEYQESLGAHFTPALALLRVPKIHLEVPILDGTDDLTLNRAVGHIADTALPGQKGNVGIAGHRDGFFRGLKDVNTGDKIEITTQKETATYVIDRITIVDPSDVSVLASQPRSSVTLVTCYPFYFIGSAPQRYIIHASLVGLDTNGLSASEDAEF